MKKRKILLIAMFIIVSVFLTSCMKKEVKLLISEIDALGEISLASFEQITSLTQRYEALDEDDKASVENINILFAAQKEYAVLDLEKRMDESAATATDPVAVKMILDEYHALDLEQKDMFNDELEDAATKTYRVLDLSSQIEKCSKETDLEILESLDKEYKSLSAELKNRIPNYSKLQKTLTAARELHIENIVNEIYEKANGSTNEAWKIYKENYELFTDEQNLECLLRLARWTAFDKAEDKLINSMKNPGAYHRYKGTASKPEPVEGDEYTYTVTGSIDCSSTNSFGGTIRDTFTFIVKVHVFPALHKVTIYDTNIRIY